MTDKEKIKAEIKRLQKEWRLGKLAEAKYRMEAYDELLGFIDSLEEKEVDLDSNSFGATVCKIGSTYLKEMDRNAIVKALEPYKDGDKVKVIITQKGE